MHEQLVVVSKIGGVVCSGDYGNDDNEEVVGNDLVYEFQTLTVQSQGWCEPDKPTKVHTHAHLIRPLHILSHTHHSTSSLTHTHTHTHTHQPTHSTSSHPHTYNPLHTLTEHPHLLPPCGGDAIHSALGGLLPAGHAVSGAGLHGVSLPLLSGQRTPPLENGLQEVREE